LFVVIRAMNTLKRREEAKPQPIAEVPTDVKLLAEIRDILASKQTPAS
jgi:large conductance mechanosensitive channel